MEFKIDTKGLEKQMKKLRNFPKSARKASARAINRTLTFNNKRVSQLVRQNYNIKSGEVKGTIKLRRANPSNLSASIKSTGGRLSLSKFSRGASSWRKGKNVRVKVKKTSNKTVNTTPKAFIANVGGNLHIAKRKGGSKFPIEVLHTLSVPQMISNSKVIDVVNKEGKDYLDKRIKHEIEFEMSKIIKG